MLSRGKISQIKTAFFRVYGVNEVEEQDLFRYGSEVIFYANQFPFEDDNLMGFRLANIHALEDSESIMEYLSKIPEYAFNFTQASTYGKLFEIGKCFGVGYKGNGEEVQASNTVEDFKEPMQEENTADKEVSNSVVGNDNSGYSSRMEQSEGVHGTNLVASDDVANNTEAINNIHTTLKEENKMSEMTAIEKLAKEAGSLGVGAAVGTNVAEVSKNDKAAAKKYIEASQTDRMNYSKHAKIKRVLITAIDREKKAVKGRASMGFVSNPQKAFEKFVAVTGCTVENGVVKFSNLYKSQLYDDALKMYQILEAAKNDPMTKVEPYFGKEGAATPVSVKGVILEDPSNKEIMLAQSKIAQHILQFGFLYLDVDSKSHAQFQLDAARSNAGSAPKKSYVVRIANKSELLEDESVCVLAKRITDKVSESKTGFKSALAVACNSSRNDANGNPKKITWRIPLEVEQYEVEVVDQYSDLFRAGVGNQTKPITLDSDDAIANAIERISNILASESAKASDKSILSAEVKAKLDEEKNKIVAADAAAVNATLGGHIGEDEFEG